MDTAATSTSLESGAAPGTAFTLGITTALANTDTLDITASRYLSAAAATTCTATIGGQHTAFTTAATSTSILRVSATGAIATGTFVLHVL